MATTIDFPTQFTDLDPDVLLGANATSPAKTPISPQGRNFIAKANPYDLEGLPLTRFAGAVNPQTGTSYLVSLDDEGSIITLDNALPITVTLPATMPVGFNVMLCQLGVGQVTCAPIPPAAVVNREGFLHTALQYSVISLLVIANPGDVAATYLLMGDAA